MSEFDYDQADEPEGLDDLSREVFNAGVRATIKAVLHALDIGASPDALRGLCTASLAQLDKEDRDAKVQH